MIPKKYFLIILLIGSLFGCGGQVPGYKTFNGPNQGYSTDDLYRFFAVAFGAAPGVTYALQLLDAANSGMSLKSIVNVFTSKSQFTDSYPTTLSNKDFAEKLITNVVGASASDSAKQEAVNDIVTALNLPGWTRGDVIYAIFNNLANKPITDTKWYGTTKKLANQVAYAKYYTEIMRGDTTELYILRSVIADVTNSTDIFMNIEQAIINNKGCLGSICNVLLFTDKPILMDSLKSKMDQLCGKDISASIQNALPMNLVGHKDGRKDILFTLWCGVNSVAGISYTKPTINATIAMVQTDDGRYRDGTKDLFGVDFLDIGGIPHYVAVYDFNNDGLDDAVFSVSREDGRDWSINHNYNSIPPAFLTSQSNGKYLLEKIGKPEWGYSSITIDNELGGKDVLVAGEVYDVYRHQGGWKLLTNYSWATPRTVFFKRKTLLESSKIAVVGENSGKQLSLYEKIDNNWKLSASYSVADSNSRKASWIGWNGQIGEVVVTNIDGSDFTSIYFDAVCELKLTKNSSPIAISALTGYKITGGFNGQVLTEGVNMTSTSKLMAFSVSQSSMIKIPLNVRNEITENIAMFGSGLKCQDVNSDGNDDIVIITSGRKPIVYINDGLGNFDLVNAKVFPSIDYLGVPSFVYEDLDGDGSPDLLYFTAAGNSDAEFPVYKGLRNLRNIDIK